MNNWVRNLLGVIVGFVLGSAINIGIIMLSPSIVPPPDGVDVTSMESLRAGIHLFEPKHFLMTLLAHALGTLVGAYFGAHIAATHKLYIAMGIGLIFMMGGIENVLSLPSPTWFIAADLVLAYLPMAWLGWRLAQSGERKVHT